MFLDFLFFDLLPLMSRSPPAKLGTSLNHPPSPSSTSARTCGGNFSYFLSFGNTLLFRVVSFLTCNFFQMRFAALCITFIINFLLLFYKASAVDSSDGGDDDDEDGGDSSAEEGSSDGDDGGDDDDEPDEWIHVDPEYYYVEYIVSGFAISHAIVAFFMVIAYYNLKVPLGIFKREKEVGRRVEFDGLYLSEQVTLPALTLFTYNNYFRCISAGR